MARKKPGKRFLIPDEDELDNPVESLQNGSAFTARNLVSDQAKSAVSKARLETDLAREQNVSSEGFGKSRNQQGIIDNNRDIDSIQNQNPDDKLTKQQEEQKEDGSDDARHRMIVYDKDSAVGNTAVQTSKPATNSIIVNARQRGNPVLKFIRNVPWAFGETIPDYVLGQTSCALFLSLRYHNFNPEYIHQRLKELGNRFVLRILLVLVDVSDPHASLKELGKICILSDCTLILSWSNEEAGRYLETYKCYEHKPVDILQEKVDGDHHSKMVDCLTSVKSVNKTDAVTLMANFGSLHGIVHASKEEISLCPGFGPQKAERLHKVLHEPFIKIRKEKGLVVPGKPQ